MSKQWYQDGYYTPAYIQSQQDSIDLASGLAIAADTAKNMYGEWQNSQNRKAMQQANQENIAYQHATNLNSVAFAHQERAANSLASRMQEYRALGLNPLSAQEGGENYAPSLTSPSVSAPQYQILERSTAHSQRYIETLRLANELANSASTRRKIESDMEIALENLSRQNKEFAHRELVDNFNMSISAREQNRKEGDSALSGRIAQHREQLAEAAAQLQERIQSFNEKEKNRRYNLDLSRTPWQSIITQGILNFLENPQTARKRLQDLITQNLPKLPEPDFKQIQREIEEFWQKVYRFFD